jgi:hypothetical protein
LEDGLQFRKCPFYFVFYIVSPISGLSLDKDSTTPATVHRFVQKEGVSDKVPVQHDATMVK